ncbi:MAG: glycerol kinase GlpK [Bryobacterales bacterium]|nr:glycerol kinase GlpK [Bryobacterales bacterium]
MPYLLALDEGTTSARAALYDASGRRVAMEAVPLASRYPQPGWVEQDPLDIWRAQHEAARLVLLRHGATASEVGALGITNQRETTLVWDRTTGQPVAPAIVWQCRRTASACAALAAGPAGDWIPARTGLVIDAYFSATKLRWILDHTPDAAARARDGELLFGTVDTWLVWKLTGGAVHATDISNASRTMLMDLASGAWDADLLDLFGIPLAMLPEIRPSGASFGVAQADHLGAEIPIAAVAGDQQAALAGQACFQAGLAKNTYGTGCFALLHTGARQPRSRHRLVATRAAALNHGPRFAIEGSTFVAGAAVQWLRDRLGLLASAAESEDAARSVPDTGGVFFVPAFVGLGAPYWDAEARGLIAGITAATSREHLIRAALESIAYQTAELIAAMEADAGARLSELRVDGGASVNDFLMQFQADILDRPIVRPADVETTASGAAYLAGAASGFWPGLATIESFWQVERRFEPAMPASRRDSLLSGWKDALHRARSSTAGRVPAG